MNDSVWFKVGKCTKCNSIIRLYGNFGEIIDTEGRDCDKCNQGWVWYEDKIHRALVIPRSLKYECFRIHGVIYSSYDYYSRQTWKQTKEK